MELTNYEHIWKKFICQMRLKKILYCGEYHWSLTDDTEWSWKRQRRNLFRFYPKDTRGNFRKFHNATIEERLLKVCYTEFVRSLWFSNVVSYAADEARKAFIVEAFEIELEQKI